MTASFYSVIEVIVKVKVKAIRLHYACLEIPYAEAHCRKQVIFSETQQNYIRMNLPPRAAPLSK